MAVAIAGNFAGDSPAPFYIAMIMAAVGGSLFALIHALLCISSLGDAISPIDEKIKVNNRGMTMIGITKVISNILQMCIRDSGYDVYVKGGRENTGIDLIEWVTKCEELGAGEIPVSYTHLSLQRITIMKC